MKMTVLVLLNIRFRLILNLLLMMLYLKVIDFNQNCINLSANKICLITHYLKFFNKELNQLFKENIYEKSRENRF